MTLPPPGTPVDPEDLRRAQQYVRDHKDDGPPVHPPAGPTGYDSYGFQMEAANLADPAVMHSEVPPKKRRHIFRWVFLAIQALFLAWIISGAINASNTNSCAGQVGDALKTCQAASGIGTTIGVGLVIALWVAVDIILALTYLIFFRKRG